MAAALVKENEASLEKLAEGTAMSSGKVSGRESVDDKLGADIVVRGW